MEIVTQGDTTSNQTESTTISASTAEVKPQASEQPKVEQAQPKEDLLTRVAKFKSEPTTKEEPKSDVEFDFKELNNVKTPEEARQFAEKAYKSMQSGFNKKFQDIAELRKSLESQKEWTPERVNMMLKDPKFVEAAKQVVQSQAPTQWSGSQEEWSSLSEQEKAKFQAMESKVNILEQQNFQAMRASEDEKLKAKYPDYAPDIVDTTINDLVTGKARATREDIWKVKMHDENVRRAYELGRQDEKNEKLNKINSMSAEGKTIAYSQDVPEQQKGETDLAWFRKLAMRRLNEVKSGQK